MKAFCFFFLILASLVLASRKIRQAGTGIKYDPAAPSACEIYTDVFGNDCAGNGQCVNGTYCICDAHYAGEFCTEKRQPQLLIFLMSFFFGGLGVDRFLLGLIPSAIGKLFLCQAGWMIPLIFMCPNMVIGAFGSAMDNGFGNVLKMTSCLGSLTIMLVCALAALAGFGFWLHDVIVTGLNTLADVHGNLPYSWSS
jgi:TM2 domain-containing membrane protein YozV